ASSSTTNSGSSSSTESSATITANDFLQLLVTEMQNQDPTANTDPNEYISQLVQVNSLEQLVQINQDIGGSSTSGTSGATGSVSTPSGDPASAAAQIAAGQNVATGGAQDGNLAQPAVSAAAARVAQALQAPSALPSAQISPGDLQTLIHRTGIHAVAAGSTISTAR
ncbi:MAG: flagellar hook capping FlgD N-terminal domain-containing protein, partial [Acidobacteriaceae bacterium]